MPPKSKSRVIVAINEHYGSEWYAIGEHVRDDMIKSAVRHRNDTGHDNCFEQRVEIFDAVTDAVKATIIVEMRIGKLRGRDRYELTIDSIAFDTVNERDQDPIEPMD